MLVTNLRLAFTGAGGKKVSFNFPFANSSAAAIQVKTLMQVIVANGDIFSEIPTALDSASFVTNTVTPVNLA